VLFYFELLASISNVFPTLSLDIADFSIIGQTIFSSHSSEDQETGREAKEGRVIIRLSQNNGTLHELNAFQLMRNGRTERAHMFDK